MSIIVRFRGHLQPHRYTGIRVTVVEVERNSGSAGIAGETRPGFFHFAGFRYWSASLLPALVGTTLPFWLRPPGFSFRWLAATEFLLATVFVHAGFSFLKARFEHRSTARWSEHRLLAAAIGCIIAGCLLGLHLNNGLTLHNGVPRSIFIIYGLSALFVGILYVAPPFSFCRRPSGEVVIAAGLGLIPVLGAYLVQVGDITRKVYHAAFPLVIATVLWVVTDELATRLDDEKTRRRTIVVIFGPLFSGRFVVPALAILLYVTLGMAAFSASIMPGGLIALASSGLAVVVAVQSWNGYANESRMLKTCRLAFLIHLALGIIIAASSLA